MRECASVEGGVCSRERCVRVSKCMCVARVCVFQIYIYIEREFEYVSVF